MANEKNWNDRWGSDATVKNRYRNLPNVTKIMNNGFMDPAKDTHIADKTSGTDHCVLITTRLVKQLLMHKAIGVNPVRLNKMVTGKGCSLSLYPNTQVRINDIWVTAKYINKDIWEFYLE